MRENILLVEDEPPLLRLMTSALTANGYHVYEARNGVEAQACFDREGSAIDLLITDMRMPYVDGAQLIESLRAQRRTLKVIAISAVTSRLGGADAFLMKPFSRDELLATVRAVIGEA